MTAVQELRRFVGEPLLACASAWHEYEGTRAATPSDTWLTFGPVTINVRGGANGHGLVACIEEVEAPFDMQEYGSVAVAENTPALLAPYVGEVLHGVRELGYAPWPGESIGLALDFSAGSVAFFNLADETEIVAWSPQVAERFSLIALDPDP
jgi:hypothetical protein